MQLMTMLCHYALSLQPFSQTARSTAYLLTYLLTYLKITYLLTEEQTSRCPNCSTVLFFPTPSYVIVKFCPVQL